VSEPCRLRRGEGYGACGDAMMDPSRSAHFRSDQKEELPKIPCDRPVDSCPLERKVEEDSGV